MCAGKTSENISRVLHGDAHDALEQNATPASMCKTSISVIMLYVVKMSCKKRYMIRVEKFNATSDVEAKQQNVIQHRNAERRFLAEPIFQRRAAQLQQHHWTYNKQPRHDQPATHSDCVLANCYWNRLIGKHANILILTAEQHWPSIGQTRLTF